MVAPWDVAPGETLRRVALHDRHGGVRQGGISPSERYVFLFTDDAVNLEHGYLRDHWDPDDPDLFLYCGEGQVGNQRVARYNASVLDGGDGRAIHLFQGVRGLVTYVCELKVDQDEPYYWAWGPGRDGVNRRVLMMRLRRARSSAAQQQGGGPHTRPTPETSPPIDTGYRDANEQIATISDRALFEVDSDQVDRALRAHATTQNLLAEWLRAHSLVPLSPSPTQPSFDIAWRSRGQQSR